MDIVDPGIERYMRDLIARDDEPVLLEMEALAEQEGFPIVDRLSGRFLEVLARCVGARRIFELGSGFGYSAYWFSKAVGKDGEIHLTDRDPANRDRALEFLGRAGLDGPITFHVGDALEAFDSTPGEFDVVFCDIDKGGYPDAWRRARDRIRVGGIYTCDNVLAAGKVVWTKESDDQETDGKWAQWAAAVKEANAAIAADDDYRSFINPTRDGVVAAVRVR